MSRLLYQGGGALVLEDAEIVPLDSHEVRLEVAFAGVSGVDLQLVSGGQDDELSLPVVPGHDMSGVVLEVGSGVSDVQVGERVVVRPLMACGECAACSDDQTHLCYELKTFGVDADGAWQTVWNVPASSIHRLPDEMTLKLGTWVVPAAVACHAVRMAEIKPGEYVTVIGAGPIGVLLAGVAQHAGAHVVVSEVNAFRRGMAAGLGFDVVDPETVDLQELVMSETGGAGADVVFEATGSESGSRAMALPGRARGRVIVVGVVARPPVVDMHQVVWRELRLMGSHGYEAEDFEEAIQFVAQRILPLDRLVTDAVTLDQLPALLADPAPVIERMRVLVEVKGL